MSASLRLLVWLGLGLQWALAADFTVTSPGSFFNVTGLIGNNPTVTLVRGETYTFLINTASLHPVRINSPTGVSNNSISQGTITFRVPTNAANYTYVCPIHGFGGTIVTVPPPTFRILQMDVGTNLLLKSTGTSTWTVFPQFSTNLARTNWLPLTVTSNRLVSGTNELICGRPPGTNVFIRLRAQRN